MNMLSPDRKYRDVLDIPAQVAAVIYQSGDLNAPGLDNIEPRSKAFFAIANWANAVAVLTVAFSAIFLLSISNSRYVLFFYAAIIVLVSFASQLLLDAELPALDDESQRLIYAIEASSQSDTAAGLYVRAQGELLQTRISDESDSIGQPLLRKAAEALLMDGIGFNPDPRLIYQIEHAAYGAVRSPFGHKYLQTQLNKSRLAKKVAAGFLIAAMFFCFIGFIFNEFSLHVVRRETCV